MTTSTSKRSRWVTFVIRGFAVLGALTFGVVVLLLAILCVTCITADRVPPRTVLEVDLERALAEAGSSDPLARFVGGEQTRLRDVVAALDRAAEDDRVAGVVAYVGASAGGMAKTQELRDAVERFRASGKFAIAYAETFGEMGSGTQGYYLATAFDEIWLQPSGEVGLVGLMSSSMFLKGTFEMLDVEVHGDRRREYKNAFNMYTERRYTEPHQEAVRTLLEDMLEQISEGIAAGRDRTVQEVRTAIEEGPFLAPAALERGLVDTLGYKDEALAAARARAGDDAELLFAHKYLERLEEPDSGSSKIAVVYGVGAVVRGRSGSDPLSGDQSMGSDTVAAAIAAAAADDEVAAIVFRVDSPGGSPIASDTIWRETVRARESGKPVIVSMGNVAASGGYYVAAGATKIVAQPGTITGSIGVFAGKPNLRKLWNKAGVTWDSVSTSPNATMSSEIHGYDEQGWASLQSSIDKIYDDFKARVAQGRSMSPEQVETIAKGRVWSGVRAHELGLVDELGGLDTAVRLAKVEAGLEPDAPAGLVEYPPSQGWLSQLLGGDDGDNSEAVPTSSASVSAQVERWRSAMRMIQSAGLGPDDRGVLQMAPLVFDGQ